MHHQGCGGGGVSRGGACATQRALCPTRARQSPAPSAPHQPRFPIRAERPLALHLTSFGGDLAAFCGHMGAAAWPVAAHGGHVTWVFPPSGGHRLVLLSPDAPEPLQGPLDPGAVYIIGGIVDKSVVKGLSLGWAASVPGVAARRLPVREAAAELGMDFDGANKSPPLGISDVVVALLEAACNGGDWPSALAAALPARVRRGGRRRHVAGSGGGNGARRVRSGGLGAPAAGAGGPAGGLQEGVAAGAGGSLRLGPPRS
jgi:hypothetical protein